MLVLVLVIVFCNIRCGHRGFGLRSSFHYVYVYVSYRIVNICILIALSINMAAPMSKHDVDVFDSSYAESNTFNLENTAWKRLEEQRYKVNLRTAK